MVKFTLTILIWAALELLNIGILFKHVLILKRKKNNIVSVIIEILLIIAILSTYAYCSWNNYKTMELIITPLIFVKSAILMRSFFYLKWRHVAFIAFFVELASFTGLNFRLITPFIGWNDTNGYVYEVIGELILLALLVFVIFLRKKSIIQFWIAELPVVDFLIFTVLLFFLSIWEAVAYLTEKRPFSLYVFFAVIVVCTLATIIRTIIITRKNNSLTYINSLLEEHMQQATDYYNQLIEQENQTKKFRHDIKNILIALHSMVKENQNDKALLYIEDLNEVCEQLKPRYNTGNFIADAILSAKDTRAAMQNINISFDGYIPSEKVKDVDMVIVLSNMLDNAIEACEKITGKKDIEIRSILQKKMWVLYIKNPSEEVNIINKNHIVTTKQEKMLHGFGLNNIERVAQKYNGNMQLAYKEGYFSSKITFIFD
ncbi:sensor histidine kinase [Pseudobutyrivibrio sp. AR14]|uniref:sensor histidine kinase n=1 Tax=Pseudobutyrivibrio sp. AR14 TaxID=1520804 RepID=UPI0015A0C57B|nr:sensor histidine kinase [Pseudobutyrivibrio sp. AR14]